MLSSIGKYIQAANYLSQKQVKEPKTINAKDNLQEGSKLMYHLFFTKSVTCSNMFYLYSKYVENLRGFLDSETFRGEVRLLSKIKLSDAIDLSSKAGYGVSLLNLFSILDCLWWYLLGSMVLSQSWPVNWIPSRTK